MIYCSKPRKLTSEDWEIMRMHPQYARDLLLSIHALLDSLEIPYRHHEHWDGNGYLVGLKREQILPAAPFLPLSTSGTR
jgi:HD-GYP domain-containing protein (c-di-GMP phosphodiesterase class II)